MRFKLLSGQHIGREKDPVTKAFKTYNPGDIIEESLALDVMFANKFERLRADAPIEEPLVKLTKTKKKEEEVEAEEESGLEEEDEKDETPLPVNYGNNITAKVKSAKAKGLLVFENTEEKFFTVFDEDRPETPLSGKLVDQKAVIAFIKTV